MVVTAGSDLESGASAAYLRRVLTAAAKYWKLITTAIGRCGADPQRVGLGRLAGILV